MYLVELLRYFLGVALMVIVGMAAYFRMNNLTLLLMVGIFLINVHPFYYISNNYFDDGNRWIISGNVISKDFFAIIDIYK